MTLLAYPATLPGPIALPNTRAERRALGGLLGPRDMRVLWRDPMAPSVPITFRFGTQEQADVFMTFLADDLVRAGAWFAAPWRLPGGRGGVFRFIQLPAFPQYMAPFVWECSGSVEVRGRTLPPGSFEEFVADLNGVTNAGSTSAVGVSITDLDPAKTYTVSLRKNGPYLAYDVTTPTNRWHNAFILTGGGVDHNFGDGGEYASAQAAFNAFVPSTISGYSSLVAWIFDSVPVDNAGGISLRLRG